MSMVRKYIPTDGALAQGSAASGGSESKTPDSEVPRACSLRERSRTVLLQLGGGRWVG